MYSVTLPCYKNSRIQRNWKLTLIRANAEEKDIEGLLIFAYVFKHQIIIAMDQIVLDFMTSSLLYTLTNLLSHRIATISLWPEVLHDVVGRVH